ncbi:carbohydrate sulfotransferase 6-like [Corticium candelabrum]|uniref:carbohydrate sulfotransferase 6-like n=1 Tax=Corticium candelabrum TaxID=121492 RepID=UPI002E2EC8E3|nr:carbohydrate sulfotransferase 6-like [Corticium candelabrum]
MRLKTVILLTSGWLSTALVVLVVTTTQDEKPIGKSLKLRANLEKRINTRRTEVNPLSKIPKIQTTISAANVRNPMSDVSYKMTLKKRLKALNDRQICALDLDSVEELKTPTVNRKFITIMATFRSGSSFLGSLFERSQQVLYFYEPFKGVMDKTGLKQDAITELLHSIASCSFSSPLSRQLIDDISASTYFPRTASRAFVFPPFCSKWCTRHWLCPPLQHKDVNHVCLKKQAVVVKTIRIENISILHTYARSNGNSIPMYVLHLVRDPRLTIMSRLNVAKHGALYNSLSQFQNYSNNISEWTRRESRLLCSKMRYNINALRGTSLFNWEYDWIAYEDLIRNPYYTVRKLYQRYGLKLTPDVTQHIAVNTKMSASSQEQKELFSIKRNLQVSQLVWNRLIRDPVIKQYIKIVEYMCKDVIDFYGYN